MEKNISCLRCNKKMQFVKKEYIQLGKETLFRQSANMFAGAMLSDIYVCPECKHIELFWAGKMSEFYDEELTDFAEEDSISDFNEEELSDFDEDNLPQRQCPNCGEWHDFDYPKCPYCKYVYDE